jgi:hypothetical protein
MKIKIQLRDIIYYDKADLFGLNPYCMNEGADGDTYIECELTNYGYEIMSSIQPFKE